jgi:hypothetical protein
MRGPNLAQTMSRKKKRRPRQRGRRGSRGAVRTRAPRQRATTPAEALADQIIALVVERAPSLGGKQGDAAGQVMFGAFVYGFRRFVAIRQLAGRDEGSEALILARSLLSLLARAAYVDAPEDLDERRRRYEQYYVKDLNDRLKTVADLIETGFDVEDTRQALRADLAPLEERGVKGLPPDDTLLRKLNLRPFYARVYRPGSEHVHFSLATAISEMRVGNDVVIERGDADLADEAMRLAIMIYGTLLEHSERTVEHGLHDQVFELSRPVLAANSDG